MSGNRDKGGKAPDLNALLARAVSLADHTMRHMGHVPPTMIAETPLGSIIHTPLEMKDVVSKEGFVRIAKMIAVGYSARAVAMILEAWMTVAKPGKPLDIDVPPSESPEREECVVIVVEGMGATQNRVLRILRDPKGAFVGFGENATPKGVHMEGRFCQIMPPKKPSAKEREAARRILEMIGVFFERADGDPRHN